MIPLAAFEEIIDASGTAPRIEAMLPAGVRARQLLVRTLLLGMLIVLADHRPAHLTRVHQAPTTLPGDDQRRLGVITDWKNGPHQLTYRQAEYTFGLVAGALAKDEPDGLPSPALQAICDDLLEASVPESQRTPPPRWPWTGQTWRPFPGPRRPKAALAPTPRPPGATARTTCCAAKTSCSTATTCPPGPWRARRTGPRSPSSPAAPRSRRAGTTRSAPWPPC
jgi:hypothetical protein